MKRFLLVSACLSLLMLNACTSPSNSEPAGEQKPPAASEQPAAPNTQPPANTAQPQQPTSEPQKAPDAEKPKTYQNDSFQDVTVKKVKEDTYEVTGKARVFEAVIDWVVEDGHNELAKGNAKTSAGAPAWGDFKFTLNVKKAEPNSTLMLILFETSAKDGSRKDELPIALPEKISK